MNQQTEQQENWKIFNNIIHEYQFFPNSPVFSLFLFFHFPLILHLSLSIIRSVSSLLWWYSWFANDDHDLQSHSNKIIQPRKFLAEINLSSESLIFCWGRKNGKTHESYAFGFFLVDIGAVATAHKPPNKRTLKKELFSLSKIIILWNAFLRHRINYLNYGRGE